MDIAFIAPYENMRVIAQSIIEAKGYPARAYTGNMEMGLKETRKALRDGAKIIISRGGTAKVIHEKLGIDVIEVGASMYRVLDYIHEHTHPQTRIAVVGFPPFISLVQPVCDTLKRISTSFELGTARSPQEVFDQVEAWKPDVIIGDAVAERMAQGRSLHFHLIESTVETLTEAFERGMLVLNNLKRHISNTEKLFAVLNCTQEGAMLVNAAGGIEEINRRGCELLRTSREAMIGGSFRRVFASRELDGAMLAKTALKNALVTVNGTPFALDLAIISPEAEVNSAVILFQKVEHLQATESSIRMKLLDKGFYAKYNFRDIIFQSDAMRQTLETAREYSRTGCNIMIQGETGVGKELFAQSIHNAGAMAGGPFVAVNCAALPGSLLESELFGYAPGAFTGALRSGKTGLFEMAHNGTLFLDEITEMDIFLQSRLLRALQAKEIMRVGDSRVIPVNVRIIAASNCDPAQAVRAGALRSDLFFRLNVLDLAIPPLRERQGDPAFLFLHYLSRFEAKQSMKAPRPSQRFLQRLNRHTWPGNVRELENLAEKYVTLRGLSEQDLNRVLPAEALLDGTVRGKVEQNREDQPETLEAAIDRHIKTTLDKTRGNISQAAALLGVNRNTIKRRLGLVHK